MVEFQGGLRAAVKPAIPKFRAQARSQIRGRGGIGEYVASQRISVRTRMTARSTDVRVVTTTPATRQTNRGWVRHPTFNRRGKGQWKSNLLPGAAGWWDDTADAEAPAVTAALVRVMDSVAAQIGRV